MRNRFTAAIMLITLVSTSVAALAQSKVAVNSTAVTQGLKDMMSPSGKFSSVEMADGTSFSTVPTTGIGDVVGPASSIDSEIAIYNSTTGKLLKRFAGTGIIKATSGVIGTATAGTDYVAPNAGITGATNTKITYDAKGLVTSGAAATTADIAASTDKNYVTDAQAVVIGNTSGTNTGDQIVPANEAGAANNFLNAYNSGTGAWTKARPTWANIDKTTSDITDITTKSHTSLSDVGTNTHATIDSHIASTSNPHSVTKAQVGLGSVEDTALSTWAGSSNITTLGAVTNITPGASFTLTQNSVIPFISTASGAIANTLSLYQGKLGVGTSTPAQMLDIYLESNPKAQMTAAAIGTGFIGRVSLGTLASPTAITSTNATLLGLYGQAYGSSAFHNCAGIIFITGEAQTDATSGGVIKFMTTSSGSTTLTEKARLDMAGNLGLGTTAPINTLTIKAAGDIGILESYTDASNYSYLKINSDSGGYKFNATQLGTGIANRPFVFLQTSSATGTGWDFRTGTGTSKVKWDVNGKPFYGIVGDSTGTPGNATLNTVSGKSAIAAAATNMTLTNSNIASTSLLHITPLDTDATVTSWKYSVGSGAGTITVNAAATATWKFSWQVIN